MSQTASLLAASRACPKHMVYGPCGGVRDNGGCEVPGLPCSFVGIEDVLAGLCFDRADAEPPNTDALRDLASEGGGGPSPAARDFAEIVAAGSMITADLTIRTTDPAQLADATELFGELTAIVAGEPPGMDAGLSPAHKALVLTEAGVRVVPGMTCRDRNRVAIEGELAALADIGVGAVLTVTGDHPASTVRADAAAVFDLDSSRVAALVRRAGLFPIVTEQPSAPPVAYRPARLGLKAQAGAELCILNLCGGVPEVVRFIAALRDAEVSVPLVVSVPVIRSAETARRFRALPGVVPPESLCRAVAESRHPEEAGVAAAVELAEDLLRLPGIAGVHLSALGGDEEDTGVGAARVLARTAALIRERGTKPAAVHRPSKGAV